MHLSIWGNGRAPASSAMNMEQGMLSNYLCSLEQDKDSGVSFSYQIGIPREESASASRKVPTLSSWSFYKKIDLFLNSTICEHIETA